MQTQLSKQLLLPLWIIGISLSIILFNDLSDFNIRDGHHLKMCSAKHIPHLQQKLNINSANQYELMQLNGIGNALASRIIEYRERYKKIKNLEDLQQIKGIGTKKAAQLKTQIRFN